jgi:mannose-6-phosphate isomerase-like protein (cupin superfamily)
MKYELIKSLDIPKVEKFGIKLDIYPDIGNIRIVRVKTEDGHNQEFYDKESKFIYIILNGEGVFFLDDEEVRVSPGDRILIEPKTRIYYKGNLEMVLITDPAWKPENEVETRPSVW